MEETLRFKGKNKNLGAFASEVEKMLSEDGYTTQSTKAPSGIIIQARKEGVLRDIFAANRAFTIMIKGKPDNFIVRIGVGKLVQNLAVTAAEALVLSELFLTVDIRNGLDAGCEAGHSEGHRVAGRFASTGNKEQQLVC